MSVIRATEIKIAEAKKNGLIKGPVHLGVGQEAIATGVSKNLRNTDRIFGAHGRILIFLELIKNCVNFSQKF